MMGRFSLKVHPKSAGKLRIGRLFQCPDESDLTNLLVALGDVIDVLKRKATGVSGHDIQTEFNLPN
ncbi:hypothetical protein DSO57_1022887 [Entomophthora muscae]|uniref:Uncharacterized protein n=1 Tax=Entomophthora muscae TaxID=34485 RepID=A0ACC2T2V8_9FUNG|nr:hypothetical protein DSO57_1022887 [Entomophthora muscae]